MARAASTPASQVVAVPAGVQLAAASQTYKIPASAAYYRGGVTDIPKELFLRQWELCFSAHDTPSHIWPSFATYMGAAAMLQLLLGTDRASILTNMSWAAFSEHFEAMDTTVLHAKSLTEHAPTQLPNSTGKNL